MALAPGGGSPERTVYMRVRAYVYVAINNRVLGHTSKMLRNSIVHPRGFYPTTTAIILEKVSLCIGMADICSSLDPLLVLLHLVALPQRAAVCQMLAWARVRECLLLPNDRGIENLDLIHSGL